MYLWPPCYACALNCHLGYLAIPGTRSLCMERQNVFVLFMCNRKKVKFKCVRINMKHISYNMTIYMRGSRKFSQSRSNVDLFLVVVRRELGPKYHGLVAL